MAFGESGGGPRVSFVGFSSLLSAWICFGYQRALKIGNGRAQRANLTIGTVYNKNKNSCSNRQHFYVCLCVFTTSEAGDSSSIVMAARLTDRRPERRGRPVEAEQQGRPRGPSKAGPGRRKPLLLRHHTPSGRRCEVLEKQPWIASTDNGAHGPSGQLTTGTGHLDETITRWEDNGTGFEGAGFT